MPHPDWENLSEFFDPSEFATTAIIRRDREQIGEVLGVFDDPTHVANLGEFDLEHPSLRFMCAEAGVKRALASAGYGDAEVFERYGWQQYDRTHSRDGSINRIRGDHWAEYRVRLTRPITIAQAALLRALLEAVAPARCHLKALIYPEADNLYDARIRHDGQFTHGVA